MNKLNLLIFLLTFFFSTQYGKTQHLFAEVGAGVGNVVEEEHTLGKGELYFNLLTSFKFGQIGLDFATGGNLIPGERTSQEGDIEILSPNDARFGTISLLYRLPIGKHLFIEPRSGYSVLSYFVHTDNDTKIKQQNLSYGLGVGAVLQDRLSVSLRYERLGLTPAYEGTKDRTTVISNAEPVNLLLFRMGYRFSWSDFTKK